MLIALKDFTIDPDDVKMVTIEIVEKPWYYDQSKYYVVKLYLKSTNDPILVDMFSEYKSAVDEKERIDKQLIEAGIAEK